MNIDSTHPYNDLPERFAFLMSFLGTVGVLYLRYAVYPDGMPLELGLIASASVITFCGLLLQKIIDKVMFT